MLLRICLVLLWLPVNTWLCQAAPILFDNGNHGNGNAFVSDARSFQYGDDFILGTQVNISGFSWFGAYKDGNLLPDGPDNFSIRIFEYNSGQPNADPLITLSPVSVSRSLTGTNLPFDNRIYAYEVTVTPFLLVPGTYLLSVVNDPSPDNDLWLWAWSDQSFLPGKEIYFRDGNGWNGPSTTQVSFKVFGEVSTVPEPSSLSLVLVGLGVAAAWVRRK
jgi:hypothetical protein